MFRSNSNNKNDNGNVRESMSRPERVVSASSQQKSQPNFREAEEDQNTAEFSLQKGQNIDRKTDDQNQTQRFYPDQQHSQHISQTVPNQEHYQAEYPQHSYQDASSASQAGYSLNPMQVEYFKLQEWILATDKEQGNRMWSGRDQAYRRVYHLYDEMGKLEQN